MKAKLPPSKYFPLVFVLIALVLGISYFHEAGVTQARNEAETSQSVMPL